MKAKLILTFTLFFIANCILPTANCSAQTPQGMNYQAVVRDVSGNIIVSSPVSFRFTITNGSGGAVQYQETQSATTNQFGLVTMNVGNGTPVSGTFAAISWSVINAWMQVELDPAGGSSYSNMGESQLLSVPYALNSTLTDAVSGTANYIPKFNNSNTLINSPLYDNAGYLGIGTTLSNSLLDIEDNGGFTYGLYVRKTGGSENVYIVKDNPTSSTANVYMTYNNAMGYPTLESHATDYGVAGYFVADGNGTGLQANANGTGTALAVYQNGSGPGLTVQTGFVGIGTTTPQYRLDVQDFSGSTTVNINNAGTGDALRVNTASGNFAINAACATSSGTGIVGTCNTGANAWGLAGYSTNGYAGYFNSTGGSAGYFAGNIAGTGTFTYTSDAKLKKNIQPLNGALNKIMLLKPSTYEYRVGEFGSMPLSSGNHFGIIAQELQQVFPELVKQDKYPGIKDATGNSIGVVDYLSVNYNELIPVLIKGMQEQQSTINELKEQVELLKSQITK